MRVFTVGYNMATPVQMMVIAAKKLDNQLSPKVHWKKPKVRTGYSIIRQHRIAVEVANHRNSACTTSAQAHLLPFKRVTAKVRMIYVRPSTEAPTTSPIRTVKNIDMKALAVPISIALTNKGIPAGSTS
jgi:hypothetical protein